MKIKIFFKISTNFNFTTEKAVKFKPLQYSIYNSLGNEILGKRVIFQWNQLFHIVFNEVRNTCSISGSIDIQAYFHILYHMSPILIQQVMGLNGFNSRRRGIEELQLNTNNNNNNTNTSAMLCWKWHNVPQDTVYILQVSCLNVCVSVPRIFVVGN